MSIVKVIPPIGAGNQVVGKVVILYGTVKAISPDGTVRLLMPNSPVFANDRIVTESDGNVSIMFDGTPPTQMDLGRMSNVAIDEDVYAGVTPGVTSDAAAEIEQIQKALLAGDQPIELEAPAAGGDTSAGGGHPLFVVNVTGAEVTPESGAETIGVSYGAPNPVEGVFTQAVTPVNNAPIAVNDVAAANDALVTAEDTPLTIAAAALTGNDSDPDGDAFSITGFTQTSHGTLAQNSDGSFTYSPEANYNGPDSFTYSITDANGATDTATVTIDVTPVNDPPVAVNDVAAANDALVTAEDTPLTIAAAALTGNDSDPDGDAFSITGFTQTDHGTLALNADGSFTYTPNANYNGPDSFTYTITDANGDTSTATVAIGVTPVNDLPTAVDDSYTTAEDTALTITAPGVLGNGDTTGGDGGALVVSSFTQTANGSLALNADGSFTYTPNANYNGPDSFTYTITDANGDTSTATVAIGVTPVNDLPTAVDDSYTTAEDTALTITAPGVLGNGDTTGGDGGALVVSSFTQTANGSLALNADGSFTYTPNANYNGPDSFTYTITDANGDTSTATVAIGVTPVNNLPTAVDDSYTTAEDTALTITAPGVLGNGDTTGGDGGALVVSSFTQTANGSLALNADGSFTYTPNANYNGPDSFTYTITDANGDTSTATVAIGVTPVNDLPTAVDDSYTTAEDTALTITAPGVLGNGDTTGGDGGALVVSSFTQTANGSLALNADGSFTYTPNANYNGPDSFTYTITDANGDTSTATVAIGVTPVNDLPTAVDDSYTTAEDTALTITAPGVLGNGDTTGGDGGALVVSSFTQTANGSLALNADGSFTYTPNANYNGPDSFTYTITDANGDTSTATVAIGVTPVNDLPTAVDDSYTTAEDTALTITAPGVLGNGDTTGGDGGALVVSSFTQTANGSLALNADGSFTYTPNANYNGPDSFTYTITDANGDTSTATVAIGVTPVNDLPTAVDDSYTTAEDTALTITAPGVLGNGDTTGGDGGALVVSSFTQTANGSLALNADGSFTYTPNANYNGPDSFTYTITDANGDTSTATVAIGVTPVNDGTMVENTSVWMSSDPSQQPTEYTDGYPLLVSIPTDVDGDNLIITATNAPLGVFYSDGTELNIGDVLYNPEGGINLLDNLVYRPTEIIDDTPSTPLQLNVFDGTTNVTQIVTINEALPTRVPGPTGELNSGNSPLTSGHNAEVTLTINDGFATALINDPYDGNLIVKTNFQQWNHKGEPDSTGTYATVNSGDQNGNFLEAQVNVYLFIDGIKFQAVTVADGNPDTWTYDPVSGLMTSSINFDNVHMASNSSTSLADYLAVSGNEPLAGDSWLVQYDDTTGGNEQARYVVFETAAFDTGDPGITVNEGDGTGLIYGTPGTDHLSGNGSDDILIGRGGSDTLDGGDGNDTVSYEGSPQGVTINLTTGTVSGGDASGDTITNVENIIGSAHDDILTGNSLANRLDGGAGNDTLTGGTGADTFKVSDGQDHITDYSQAEGDKIEIAAGDSYSKVLDDNGYAKLVITDGAIEKSITFDTISYNTLDTTHGDQALLDSLLDQVNHN